MEHLGESQFSHASLRLDAESTVNIISAGLRRIVPRELKRRGLVIGLSGGIDSTVTLGLAVEALGPERVLALLMPDRDSSPDTMRLSRLAAEHFGVQTVLEDITAPLESLGHYRRYAEAARMVIPEYGDGWKSKIVTRDLLNNRGFTFFNLVAQAPDNRLLTKRLSMTPYLQIVAAMNFKQRTRKTFEYYHADRLNYAVAGTPNRLEYELGFFVKLGDGAADVKPIAHLYKSQVYQIANYLKVPSEIINRPPTTDTYSLPQGQDEFFFSLPYDKMDLCLYGLNNGIPADEVARAVQLNADQVKWVFADIESKRSATRYLHLQPLVIEEVGKA